MRRLSGLLAALLLFTAPAFAADPSRVEAAFHGAATAYLRGDYVEAARGYEAALAALPVAGTAPDPEHERTAYTNLATLYWLQGRYADAEAMARRLISATRTALGDAHPEMAKALNRLGTVLRSQGRYDEAEQVLNQALAILEPIYGVDHLYVAECLNGLAEVSRLRGEPGLAERRYWRAYMIRSYLLGPESSAVGETLKGLGTLYLASGRADDAKGPLARALAIAEKPPRTGAQGWGRLDERDLRELLPPERETYAFRGQMFVRTVGPQGIEYAQHYDHLAELYRLHGRNADAEAYYRRSMAIRARAFGPEHPELAQSLAGVALAQQGAGNAAAGVESARQAAAALAKRIEGFGPERADYARAEKRRWRPVFLLALSLVSEASRMPEAERLAESFSLIQLADPNAADTHPAKLDELRRLLFPGETLVALAGDAQDTFAFVATAQGAAGIRRLHASTDPDPVGLLQKELGGAKLVPVDALRMRRSHL